MDGHWAPDAHDEELHEECARNEAHPAGKNVRGDQSAANDTSDDHGQTATGECGDIAQYSAPDDGADLADAGDDGRLGSV